MGETLHLILVGGAPISIALKHVVYAKDSGCRWIAYGKPIDPMAITEIGLVSGALEVSMDYEEVSYWLDVHHGEPHSDDALEGIRKRAQKRLTL